MSEHEKAAWWALGSGALIWLFLATRFTHGGRLVDVPAGLALETYVEMVVLWIVAAVVPAVFAARNPAEQVKDERDRAIDARGGRWEGYFVLVAVNVLIVHLLARGADPGHGMGLPGLGLSSTSALVFVLLSTLFAADIVKQAVILWQYRR
jgi:hypothetical protein